MKAKLLIVLKRIVLFITVAIAVASCGKNDVKPTPPAPTQAELLVKSPWHMTKLEFFVNGSWIEKPVTFDGYVEFANITFTKDSKFTATDPTAPDFTLTGTWSVGSSVLDITYDGTSAPEPFSLTTLSTTMLQTHQDINTVFSNDDGSTFHATGQRFTFSH